MGTGEFNAGGNPAMDWHPIQGGLEIFLVASCHGNRDKLRPDGPLGSYADFTYMGHLGKQGWRLRALATHQCVPGSIPGPAPNNGLSLLLVLALL